uniref:Uncharacterized protein n=1 Tax=uncultured marine virus TaxID=186617 RepID=A0A0F7L8Y8_9VIRU|nr:hypothetical protein [uncultured marine virus]
MKKVKLYTRLSGDTYMIMDEMTDEVYATAATNIIAEIVRKSLEDYMNGK